MSLHANAAREATSHTNSGNLEADEAAGVPVNTDLQHLADGDSEAFWRLWKEHEAHLYRICLHQLDGVQEEAEDALSILMVKLVELLPRHADQIRNLRAWLTRITYNLCIDIRREFKRSKAIASIEDLTAMDQPGLLNSTETPEDTALRLESRQFIYRAIENLSANLRLPFLLHHLYEWPYNEIASYLDITPENARKRSQLGRAFLQQSLGDYRSGAVRAPLADRQIDLDACLQRFVATAPPASSAVRLINVVLNSGLEKSFCIHLDQKPAKLYPKIEQVMRYTSSHPRGWKKRLELAQLLYAAGDWGGAVEEYERVLEKQPRLFDVYLDLGNLLSLMDHVSDSIATYQKALKFIDEAGSRHHLQGMIALRRKNYQTAVAEFHEATQVEPDKVAHWQGLALVHLRRDSPLDALTSWNETLRLDPGNAKALTYLPGLLRDLGRVREAARYVDKSLSLNSENVLAIKSLADYRSRRRMVLGQEGKKTLTLIKNALRLAPQSPEVHESLSFFHLCRGDWEQGVEVLRIFAEQHRSSPAAWYYYARALFRIGDVCGAAEAIRRPLALDPDSWKVNSAACDILSCYGPLPELRNLVESMLLTFPERWSAWAKVGLACIVGLNDAEQACVISAQAPRLQPELPGSWFQHGKVLGLAGRYAEAIRAGEVGWRWLPTDEDGSQSIPAAFQLAESCLLINAVDRAKLWIDEASQRLAGLIALSPAEGSFWQGKLLELSGDKRGAAAAFTTSVKHNLFYPDRAEAENALANLTTPLSKRAGAFPVG